MLFRAVVVLAILCAISAFTVPVTRRASALRSLSMEGEAAPAAPAAPAPAEPAAPATPPAPVVEFSRSLPFLIKPKNLDGMIVSTLMIYVSLTFCHYAAPDLFVFATSRAMPNLTLLDSVRRLTLNGCVRLRSSTVALPCSLLLVG